MKYGEGVNIPSQRRWIRYAEFFSKLGKKYVQGEVEILRIEFWGMRISDGADKIKVGVAGFVDGLYPRTKTVEEVHLFEDSEVKHYSFFINDRG